MWSHLAARLDLVAELGVVKCGAGCKTQQVEQSLILTLFGYEHQAVKQSPEVITIHYAISVLIHKTKSSQNILKFNNSILVNYSFAYFDI